MDNMVKRKIINICDKVIEGCFYALLVVVTFSTSLVEIFASLMIVAWFTKKIAEGNWKSADSVLVRIIRIIRVFWRSVDSVPVRIILVFFLWSVLSCVNSDYFRESFRGIFKVLEYALIFVIVSTEMRKEVMVKRSIYVIIAAVLITCTNGMVQYFTGEGLIRHRQLIHMDYLRRISSSFIHPNDFGVYLLVVTIIFLSFILSKDNRFRAKAGLLVPFVLSITSLFLTRSRGAWISFAGAFLVLGALKAKKMLAISLALLLIVFIMLPYTVQESIFSMTDIKSGTTWERLMLWKGTIDMVKEHPILGFGINTYSRNFPKYKPPEYPDYRYTHNSYLHMASEVGIVGMLIFLFFLLAVLVYSLKGIYLMTGGTRKNLAGGLFAGLVGFSICCIVDTHLYSVNLAVFFHLLLGFCFALTHHARND